jgi:uncharacterized RDD family membrane protein YckC
VREGIVTPEAVVLRFETAGVPSRAIAKALDVAIAALATLAGVLLAVAATGGSLGSTMATAVVVLVSGLAVFGYPAYAEARYGTTVGKAAAGLRVVTAEGGPAGARHTTIRAALQVVDFLLPPIGVVAVLSSLASPLDQRLGDRVAGTIVLRARNAAADTRALVFPPLPGYEAFVASLDVTAVRPEQYEVLRSFLTRVTQLHPDARLSLAQRLASSLAAVMGQPLPPGLHPELYCACVASSYQQRYGAPG